MFYAFFYLLFYDDSNQIFSYLIFQAMLQIFKLLYYVKLENF